MQQLLLVFCCCCCCCCCCLCFLFCFDFEILRAQPCWFWSLPKKNRQRSDHDAIYTLATHVNLFHDVTYTKRHTQHGTGHGRVFAATKRQFFHKLHHRSAGGKNCCNSHFVIPFLSIRHIFIVIICWVDAAWYCLEMNGSFRCLAIRTERPSGQTSSSGDVTMERLFGSHGLNVLWRSRMNVVISQCNPVFVSKFLSLIFAVSRFGTYVMGHFRPSLFTYDNRI